MTMKTREETRNTPKQFRSVAIERAAVDEEARTAPLSFSSEEPYERYWGTEILDHNPSSLRLGRLQDGGALLLDHDPRRHIGVVEGVVIGKDRRGRAVARFGRSAEAEAAFRDVLDGIRKHVSVGYWIHKMVLEEQKEGRETYRVTDWEPLEVSLVAIPADPTVGVGRSIESRDAAETVPTVVVHRIPDDVQEPTQQQPTQTRITMTTDVKPADQVDERTRERARRDGLTALQKQYSKFVDSNALVDAINRDQTVEQFKDRILAAMESKHSDTSALHVGMTPKELKRYSFGRAILAQMTGDWRDAGFEREASAAVASIMGSPPEGFYVPLDYLSQKRDFNVGTTNEAGYLVPTNVNTDMWVDALRNAQVLGRMGIRFLSGLSANVDIPRKATPGTLGMLTEIGSASETQPNTAKTTLSPKRIGAFVDYSKQALIQSAIPLEAMLRDDLVTGSAVLLEDQVLNGAGTGAHIRGIRNTTGIGTVVSSTNGAALTWSDAVDLESNVANSNAEPDASAGYIINTRTRGKAKKTQRGTNLGFIWDNGPQPLNGYRAGVTNNMPSNLTAGTSTTVCSAAIFSSDYGLWVVGLFGAPDVTVDPYTLSTTGQVRITLNNFADAGPRQPAAFAKCDTILTS